MSNKVVCVIPVFNEEDVLEDTIKAVRGIDNIDNILVVNDGSTDSTLDVIESMDIDYLSYEKNMGKGYAIKQSLGRIDYSHLVLLDGDVGETADEIERLISISLKEDIDAVVAQFPSAKTNTNKKGGLGFVKRLARDGVKFFTGAELSSSLSGQRIYKKEVLDTMDYIPNRYGVEVAMTIQCLNNGFNIEEIPVKMTHRYTARNLKGFIHRGKQYKDILKTFIVMYFKGYKKER